MGEKQTCTGVHVDLVKIILGYQSDSGTNYLMQNENEVKHKFPSTELINKAFSPALGNSSSFILWQKSPVLLQGPHAVSFHFFMQSYP